MWNPMMYGYGAWGWMAVVNGVFWLALLALAVALVWRPAGGPHRTQAPRASGLDILQERYARGEIQREEYLQKRKDILQKDA